MLSLIKSTTSIMTETHISILRDCFPVSLREKKEKKDWTFRHDLIISLVRQFQDKACFTPESTHKFLYKLLTALWPHLKCWPLRLISSDPRWHIQPSHKRQEHYCFALRTAAQEPINQATWQLLQPPHIRPKSNSGAPIVHIILFFLCSDEVRASPRLQWERKAIMSSSDFIDSELYNNGPKAFFLKARQFLIANNHR